MAGITHLVTPESETAAGPPARSRHKHRRHVFPVEGLCPMESDSAVSTVQDLKLATNGIMFIYATPRFDML